MGNYFLILLNSLLFVVFVTLLIFPQKKTRDDKYNFNFKPFVKIVVRITIIILTITFLILGFRLFKNNNPEKKIPVNIHGLREETIEYDGEYCGYIIVPANTRIKITKETQDFCVNIDRKLEICDKSNRYFTKADSERKFYFRSKNGKTSKLQITFYP